MVIQDHFGRSDDCGERGLSFRTLVAPIPQGRQDSVGTCEKFLRSQAVLPPLLLKGVLTTLGTATSWIRGLPYSLSHRVGLGKRPSWGAGH